MRRSGRLAAPVVLAVRPPPSRAERQVPDAPPAHPLRRLVRELGSLRGLWHIFLVAAVLSSVTTHTLELLGVEAATLSLRERANKLRRELEKQREEKEVRGRLAARREVRADIRGTVRFVYNTKASSDRILSGEILVEVAPVLEEAGALYAKFKLTQQEVKRVLAGQPAHLKLDAFHFHRYGVLKGRVRYVSPPNDANEFFAIVDLPPPHPFEDFRPPGDTQAGPRLAPRRAPRVPFAPMHSPACRWLLLAGVLAASACATAPASRTPPSEGLAPSPAPLAARPEAPRPTPGLHFDVLPAEAQIFVDGQLVGTAASLRERGGQLELPAGIHQIILKHPDHVTWRAEVAVGERSEPIRVTLDPRP